MYLMFINRMLKCLLPGHLTYLVKYRFIDIQKSNVYNFSLQEMLLTLRDFAQLPQHSTVDSCVVVLLTHGLEGQIYGSDAKLINLTEVFGFFDGNVCPNLQGKPKFFLVQACRGGIFLYLYVCLAFACHTSYFLHRHLFQHRDPEVAFL